MSDSGTTETFNFQIPATGSLNVRAKAKPIAKRTCIMVLGMHSSGTSAVARAISLLGAELPRNILPPAADNRKGFWESVPLVTLHERLLKEAGSRWDDWRDFEIASLPRSRIRHYKVEIARLLVEEFGEPELFVLKEPRISRFAPLYAEVLKAMGVDVRYVLVNRNPFEVAASLEKRYQFTLGFCCLLWLRHTLDAEHATRGKQRVFVSYQDLTSEWRPALSKIVDELDLAWPLTLREAADNLNRYASTDHHTASAAELVDDNRISLWVNEAYAALNSLAIDKRDKSASHSLDRIKAELDTLSAISGDTFFSELDARLKVQRESGALHREQREGVTQASVADQAQRSKLEFLFSQERLQSLISDLVALKMHHREQAASLETANKMTSELCEVIGQIHASRSWRVTRPMRAVARILRGQATFSGLFRRMFHQSHDLKAPSKADVPTSAVSKFLFYSRVISTETISRVRTPHDALVVLRRALKSLKTGGATALLSDLRRLGAQGTGDQSYASWISAYDACSSRDITVIKSFVSHLPEKPLISIVMPVYDTPEHFLREAIESVLAQHYERWELCIADDASTQESVAAILGEYAARDPRIKIIFRPQNGHISHASNSAISLCTGEWIAFLDHDDTLAPHALVCIAKALADNPDAKLLYSDEDKIDEQGNRCDPYFKSDWNVDLFRSHNLVTHLAVYHTQTVRDLGGCRPGFEGAQDYDLALRFTEAISPEQIVHIPHVLYHWRTHQGSTAKTSDSKPYAMLAGERALNEHLKRVEPNGVAKLAGFGFFTRYPIAGPLPLVSVIIPTRNASLLVQNCIGSIKNLTGYSNFEIILVDNGSTDPQALEYFSQLSRDGIVRVVRDDGPFNFSRLNNNAVNVASGEVIALVNNDIEVIAPDWLTEMVEHALRPGIGAVGARLLYPNGTLQHGGIIMGLGGLAAHAHQGFDRWSPGYVGRAALNQNFAAVTGACLVVTKANYESVGGLNETNLAVAYNDVDFCLRLREIGLRNIWLPGAELFHHESATRGYEDTAEKRERFGLEKAYMVKRWSSIIANDPYYSPNLTVDRTDFSIAFPPRVSKPWEVLSQPTGINGQRGR
ncbi:MULTISPECIES: glycosyltransferase [unclassified Mesorhizobium]|uniref:glycosyltransferase n=1 Tax=unclassified Mesorhizobium TaxID=325217 RepID=UPI00042086E1|nr:glycosyltransferase [Mesorhizobium sp. L103C565B0]